MKNTIYKIFLTIFVFGFMIWFGGSVIRSAIAFDLLEPGKVLHIKESYPERIRMHSVYLYSLGASYTIGGFFAAFISSFVLLARWSKRLKDRGWLFMSFVLFYITAVVEIILFYYDMNLGWSIFWDRVRDIDAFNIHKFFLGRYRNIFVATSSGIGFLSAITLVIYLIWRPLNKVDKKEI